MEGRPSRRKHSRAELVRRIVSVVEAQELLFDSPFIDLELGAGAEYRTLLDFAENPTRAKIRRLASVLRAHAALFDLGLLERDRRAEEELRELLRFLSSYAEYAPTECAPSAFLPKNLGSVFVRKGFGIPLFGLYRPREVPAEPGLILCHYSILAGGTARLLAVPTGSETAVRYQGLGAEVDSSAPSLHCSIAAVDEEAVFTPAAAFARRKPTVFEFDRYSVYLAAGKTRTALRKEELDPLRYRYAYFFFGGPSLGPKLRTFLIDLLSGMYRIPVRRAEAIASLFTERSL